MHRQRFSFEGIPAHVLRFQFEHWLKDISVARPFLLDDNNEDCFVVGHNAYSMLISMYANQNNPLFFYKREEPASGTIQGIRVETCAFEPQDTRNDNGVDRWDIEYRILEKHT